MKEQQKILSSDGITQLNVVIWTPDYQTKPVAILQLIHGMAEYIERYDEFATYLNKYNIAVIGHDHLGHGDSLPIKEPILGYFSEKDSPQILISDCRKIQLFAQHKFQNLPYFILGHSMGSFILRNYLREFSNDIDGAILMGTGGPQAGLAFAKKTAKVFNHITPKKPNPLINQLAFGLYNQPFPEKNSNFAWISRNQQNVLDYEKHPKTGFMFTSNGFYTLFQLVEGATAKNWFVGIRQNLPILLISGEEDPVGQMGKGPRTVAKELSDAKFTSITLALYPHLRHEVLNEDQPSKEMVFRNIKHWLSYNSVDLG